jgi:hypothetical protein
MSEEFPGWEIDAFGGLTLTVTIGGEEIQLATAHGQRNRDSSKRQQQHCPQMPTIDGHQRSDVPG